MVSFESDYNNGAHPVVLQRIIDTNAYTSRSYGFDEWSDSAREKIRKACQCPEADICFLVGGTQTNAVVIDAIMNPHEGVIAVDTAHINVHEAGAVEANGHKILVLPSHNGKLEPGVLANYLQRFYADDTHLHMVPPGMVYITFPTELGTLYSADDITQLYDICQEYHIPLYIDGARLGYGLMADECDFDMAWLARHCDTFYIGGTKVGALCGEAVVFPKGNEPRLFQTIIKRHGAMLAKSRLAGVQFDALFTDNLYFDISRHAIQKAMLLRNLFTQAGIMPLPSPTNQQFVVLNEQQRHAISKKVAYEVWGTVDKQRTTCRFVTSWATTDADLQQLDEALKNCQQLMTEN